jgi:nucleotide-binding universal stress UspA family protein
MTPFNLRATPPAFRLRGILVPIDFSESSKKALRYAQPFAEQFGAEIILLHVVGPMMRPEGYMIVPAALESRRVARMDEREARLGALRHHEIGEGIKGDTIVQMGEPFKEIINMAKARKVDLIIIATHGYSGVKHAFLGSTTERVVRHAPCPVLVVREKENEFV